MNPHEQWLIHRKVIDRTPKIHNGYRLNAYPSPPSDRPRLMLAAAGTRPRSMSYRANCPPIWDQGQRGTCTAHGVTRVICNRFITGGQEPVSDLSREFAYWAAKQLDGMPQQDGSTAQAVFQAYEKYGSCPAILDPYNPSENDLALTAPTPAMISCALLYRIPSSVQILGNEARNQGSIDAICNALWQYGPVSVSHLVCSNFTPDPKTNVIPLPAGSEEGGHEECIVGYNDDTELFEVANSWGTSWGDAGHWYMPYAWITASYDPLGDGSTAYYVYDSFTTTMLPAPKDANVIVLTDGSNVATVDGEQVELDQAPEIDATTNRALLPVRFLGGNTGRTVTWNGGQITLTKVG